MERHFLFNATQKQRIVVLHRFAALCLSVFAILQVGCRVEIIGSMRSDSERESGPTTVAISSLSDGDAISASDAANFLISGTCSDSNESVIIYAAGSQHATAICADESWSAFVDLSGIGDGIVNVYVTHGSAQSSLLALLKDTQGPANPTIGINDGFLNTTDSNVTLSLSADSASSMYVTNVSGCSSGGSWEAIAASKAWVLGQTNATATVYVKFKDAAGNETACIGDSIHHGTGTVFAEDFSDGLLHSNFTDFSSDIPAVEGGGQLTYTLVPNVTCSSDWENCYGWTQSARGIFTGGKISVEVAQVDTTGWDGETYFGMILAPYPVAPDLVLISHTSGDLYFTDRIGGVSNSTSIPYNPATQRYWRIRHDSGTDRIHFETSSDNSSWTSHRDIINSFDLSDAKIEMGAGTWDPAATPGSAVFDNLKFER